MPANADKSNPVPSLRGVRVLVVEDGWQVADALRVSLENMGMIVSGTAATAAEARRLAGEHRPELAIVDVNLKGQMAYTLMDWLHHRGIGVIVISGYADLPASLAKFAAILQKPFTAAALRTALHRALDPDRAR
jgi:DNA-binding NtrC family response regulator